MKLKIDHKSKLPLHFQVEELIRNLLTLPEYQAGAFLPKEVELANTLGVSRNTIRQATNKLEYEGLLIRKKGIGTKMALQHIATNLSNWHSFTEEMKQRGVVTSNLFLAITVEAATKHQAQFFGIKEGTNLTKLTKLKGVDGEAIVLFESFFHPRITLSDTDDLNLPLYTLLNNKYGIVVVRSKEHISARKAGLMAVHLNLDKDEPILYRERYVFDPGDRPIEYNIGYYRSDKFIYSIEITSKD